MNIILLSGGSGRRLWPLSNEVRSKQFLNILKKDDGTHESMLRRMYRMITEVDSHATVTVAASDNQVSSIREQLGEEVDVSIEPCRRDTFPAIALAIAYLHDVKGVPEEEAVIVCPVDSFVDASFFQMLGRLYDQASEGTANLHLIGVEPTYPSEKYGYIIPENTEPISSVQAFKEKPDAALAEQYITMGALWNAGIFAFKLKYVLDIARKALGTSDYRELYDNYTKLNGISFDYAVVEKEKDIQVMRYAGQWKDLGTWNTLTEAMSEETYGNVIAADCTNTHVINELDIPLIALGVDNLAIVATPDGILVTRKDKSDKLKNSLNGLG